MKWIRELNKPPKKAKWAPPFLPHHAPKGERPTLLEALPFGKFRGSSWRSDYFRARGALVTNYSGPPPAFFENFDWVVGYPWGWGDPGRSPHTVFCHPLALSALMRVLPRAVSNKLSSGGESKETVLVLGGVDKGIRDVPGRALRAAKKKFDRVYIQANDGSDPGVRTFPVALSHHYIFGYEEFLQNVREAPQEKENLVLASWGAVWPELNAEIPDRTKALRFVEKSKWIEMAVLPRDEYFVALARSKFMLYPRGNGVQSPKGYEALLLGCVPIVTRHPAFEELADRGLPLLIVEEWNDITEEFLVESWPECEERLINFTPTIQDQKLWFRFSVELPHHS